MKDKLLAHISKRVFATIIDYVIVLILTFIYIAYFGKEDKDVYIVTLLKIIPLFVIWFIYFVVIEGTKQATLGHQVFGLKVCQEDLTPIKIKHSFKRRVLDLVDFPLLGIPAIVAVKNSKKRQRFGDMFAKTIVVAG